MITSRSLIVKILYIKNPHALNEEAVVKIVCALLIYCLVNCLYNRGSYRLDDLLHHSIRQPIISYHLRIAEPIHNFTCLVINLESKELNITNNKI